MERARFTAKDRWSWILIDFANSAFATTILAAVFPVYLPSLLPKEGIQFQIGSLSWTSTAMSLWAYTVSFSILITLLISPLLGAWADQSARKLRVLGIFTMIGALATIGLGWCADWKSALLTFVVANVGFTASNVFYNALISSAAEEKDWHKVSLQGFAWGYIGGGILLAFNLLMIMKHEWFGWPSKQQGLEWSFVSVGIWWIIFTLPALFILKEDPPEVEATPRALFRRVFDLWKTIKSIPQIPYMLIFMLSFAFYNDAIQTIIAMASIFGKEVLALSESTLIGTLLMIQFLGLPFTLLMDPLEKKFGAKRVLMCSLCFWFVIVFFAYRMTNPSEFWILGVLVALVLGVSQSLSRSIFASMIPRRRQGEFFSFFALSGKMTSIMGPLLFGFVRDATGNPRLSILSLGVLFLLGIILLFFVKVRAGAKLGA